MKTLRTFVLSILIFASGNAFAGGFMIGEMATRASGMASAFTAVADDASAAWHNPAGVAFTTGNQLMLGGDVLITSNEFSTNTSNPSHPGVADAGSKAFIIPHAYYTFNNGSSLGASLSINAPFGLETDWPETGPFAAKSTFSRLNMVMINPSVVFQVSDRFSIAVGVDYASVYQVDLNSTLQDLSGDGDGWGGNASIFYKGDSVNFGVTYRSRIKADLNGSATAKSTLKTLGGTTSTAHTSVTLPDQVNVGIALFPNEQWTLSLDVDWVNWKTYDAVDITYDSATYLTAVRSLQTAVGASVTGSTHIPHNWKATVAFRLGTEWKYNSQMRARFGYIYDPTPIRDVDFSPTVPGNDRHIISIGHGYDFNPDTTLDLGYAYVHINERNQTLSPATPTNAPDTVKNGIYKGNAHIIMASLNYRF